MRLRRLDLTRYGKFTDRSIDFGERTEGQPDLHVIYGPNEAGKSTALAAFLDLLFGIGSQSPFDFIHPYPTMRIGAALDLAGDTREFARIKRPQNSLLDGDGRTLPEAAIRAELGGIERDAYRTMFSLDDETLEKGGESILASRGDLGQLLFSASAGLSHLSDKLVGLKGEADGFYKYRARTGALADLKARLAELKAEREQFDTLASDHARLIDTRDRASVQYDEAVEERGRIHRRSDEIQRYLTALPRLSALRGIHERLAPLADVPADPPAWAGELPQLRKQEIELGVKTRAIAEQIDQLAVELAEVVVDEAALRLEERVERLADSRARHVTADKDIPERRLQLRQLDLAISGILQRIERSDEPDPKRLVLPAATIGRLRDLIESRSGIEGATRNAARELAEARQRLDEATSRLPEGEADPQLRAERDRALAELAVVVEAIRSADHHIRRRLAERAREAALDLLTDRLATLGPRHGTVDELAAMQCPSAEALQRWKAARGEAEVAVLRHQAEVERLTTLVRHCEAEEASFASTTGIVSDHEAADIRSRREQTWSAHRRLLDADSADAFEAALRQDDIINASRFSHISELAKLHQSGQALALARADHDRAVELSERAATALAAIDVEIAAAVQPIASHFAKPPSLPDIDAWISRREKALEASATVRTAERDIRNADADGTTAAKRLAAAITAAGLPPASDVSFDAMLASAQTTLDREAELRRLRGEVDERRREVTSRERAAEQAGSDDRTWEETWSTTCRGCWLGEVGEAPAIGAVREVLSAIIELSPTIEKRAALIDRIEKMERDQLAFGEEVTALTTLLKIDDSADPALELAQRIGETVRNAAAARQRHLNLTKRLEDARARQRELAEATAVHDEQTDRMTAFFQVTSLDEVAQKLSDIARRADLVEQARQAEQDIVETLRATDLQGAQAALDAADRPALETELAELTARADDQDKRCHELFAAKSAAEDRVEAIGGDARVAIIEERRRTTLLEIEDGAMRYLQLRAGIAATQQALATYRERHRSSMMTRASEAFRTISRGAYTGLVAQPGRDGDTLIAVSAEGGSKAADKLSKGTRFQLYLALRVAGYYEFVRARSSVPFVADDIMETFDDFRAEEAFRLFSEMSQVGQVIYLTHHQHLCEIVQRVCPGAQLHRLEDEVMKREFA
ncbi:ATP-binding protein [Rhodopseudomonas pseudopalustris]|uniref:AAA domain-containing protein n=1 Tax=Rhodopseudomonas pseudopalustris TaxID=1513892 RepID=A0A1H8WZF8_9BRAD|nr:AAA family ATPase [Rhodopseudomonas pseudopalustris]SEP33006.1 AAA domain-containing protein [Rhodopseudomonas pseudopalustris]